MKKKKDNLKQTHPDLANEWHPTKNGTLTPEHLTFGSNKKVWWQCVHGHEWEVSPNSRTARPTGCPYCSGRRLLVGFNDLATTHPDLVAEWHPTKNGDLTPKDLTYGSGQTVWWQCQMTHCQHEWQDSINHRTSLQKKCCRCQNQSFSESSQRKSFESLALAVSHPDLATEWHPTKNGGLTPHDLTAKSVKKVWWMGACGHEWETTVRYRSQRNSPCPYCSNRRLLSGFNDLATKYPTFVNEWHPTKNGLQTPKNTLATATKVVWWKGVCGHEWEATVEQRTRKKAGCPYCANRRILKGFNDLATTHPHLINEWHYSLNLPLRIDNVFKGSQMKVWWRCEKGHEWKTQIHVRARGGGCPYCSGWKKEN